MIRQGWLSSLALASFFLVSTASAEVPSGAQVSMQDLHFIALDGATLAAPEDGVGHKPMVVVTGHNPSVKLVPSGEAVKQGKLSFGIRHVDTGAQGFNFSYESKAGIATIGIQRNNASGTGESVPSPDKVGKKYANTQVDESGTVIPGTGESIPGTGESIPGTGESIPGSATITANFPGAATWSLRVTRKGKVLHDLTGLSGPYTVPHFEGRVENRKTETLKVRMVYGLVRPDAWSFVFKQEGHTVTITADGGQKLFSLGVVVLRATGLDEMELVDMKLG